jgi:hypothetical protein
LTFGARQGVNEQQLITRLLNQITFFSFNGVNSTQITMSATTTPVQIQNILSTIPALNGNVLVTGNNGGPWTVEFRNSLASRNVSQIGVNNTAAVQIQTLVEGVDVNPISASGATVQLLFNGELASGTLTYANTGAVGSSSIPTAAQVRQSLETIAATPGLAALAGNVHVFGRDGGPFHVIFRGALAGKTVPEITPVVFGDEVQRLTFNGAVDGTFTLSIRDQNNPTPDSGANAADRLRRCCHTATNATEIQNKLNDMLVGSTQLCRGRGRDRGQQYGFTLQFQGPLARRTSVAGGNFPGTLTPPPLGDLQVLLEGGGNTTQVLTFVISLAAARCSPSTALPPRRRSNSYPASPTAQQVQSAGHHRR